jgi:hypothetical protein
MQQVPAQFENQAIRRLYDDATETWWFSVVDIVQVLMRQPDFQTARKYWNKLKTRLNAEGSESVTKCHRLKLLAADGKLRLTDVASEPSRSRFVQSKLPTQRMKEHLHSISAPSASPREPHLFSFTRRRGVRGGIGYEPDFQTARKYWNKLKTRLNAEGSESVTKCHRLKLLAADGKLRLTDVASEPSRSRFVQSKLPTQRMKEHLHSISAPSASPREPHLFSFTRRREGRGGNANERA